MEHVNAEILRAIADGEKVQYRHKSSGEDWIQRGPWKDFNASSIEPSWNLLSGDPVAEWRIAPKTIKIGEHEVPEPCREPLERDTNYWTFTPFVGAARTYWLGTDRDKLALEGGFIHLTQEAAEAHYEAIKSMSAKT